LNKKIFGKISSLTNIWLIKPQQVDGQF